MSHRKEEAERCSPASADAWPVRGQECVKGMQLDVICVDEDAKNGTHGTRPANEFEAAARPSGA